MNATRPLFTKISRLLGRPYLALHSPKNQLRLVSTFAELDRIAAQKAAEEARFSPKKKKQNKFPDPVRVMESQGPKKNAKRPAPLGQGSRRQKQRISKAPKPPKEGSADEILLADIQALLAKQKNEEAADGAFDVAPPESEEVLPESGTEIEIEITEQSSTGDGLGFQKGSKRIYVVPFCVPGDTVKAKVFRHVDFHKYSIADFISVVTPSPLRDDSRIKCGYFSKCSGCQFQMLDYDEQLRHKQRVLQKAYKSFSNLPPELIPAVQDTMGSPLQYGYRTKLTPHFDSHVWGKHVEMPVFKKCPDIGFMLKGTRKTIDIEDCPLGTEVVRKGLTSERARMGREYATYKRGATILLRESTRRLVGVDTVPMVSDRTVAVRGESDQDGARVPHVDVKTCITDNNATSQEYIGPYVFTNLAGSFFQNNNSILPSFTAYVRENILPKATTTSATPKINYLIDAYCGSGLFTITLASTVPGGSVGIDIDPKGIDYAWKNAELNGLVSKPAPPSWAEDPLKPKDMSSELKPEDKKPDCKFIAADANELFQAISFPPDETVVVLDPPRKGCDANFLKQLLALGPARVLYVSCNVHTQARDVGILVRGHVDGEEAGKTRYEIESLRGFDFFPQTGHVEGVAVLNRVVAAETETAPSGDAENSASVV